MECYRKEKGKGPHIYDVLVEGQPVFDIFINDRLELESFQPTSGKLAMASRKEFEVTLEDAFLELAFRAVLHNPVIAAIEIEKLP